MNAFRIAGSLLLLFLTSVVAAAATQSFQTTSSQVDALGVTQVRDDDSTVDGAASTQAVWPAGTGIAQGRTAARSRAAEIAANARVFSESFNSQTFDLALSQAFYAVQLDPVVVGQNASVDFFLPPSYLELVHNAEVPFLDLDAVFFADLRVCFDASCNLADQVFFLQAELQGDFNTTAPSMQLSGHPSLDLTPLMNPTFSDSGAGFIRTYLYEFPAFSGHVDIGFVPANLPLRVEYTLQARASGQISFNSAIAAVNDPFLVDTDPVQQGIPLVVTVTPVPEPSTCILCSLGIAAITSRRLWRVNCSPSRSGSA
jgi:hypothetical protein